MMKAAVIVLSIAFTASGVAEGNREFILRRVRSHISEAAVETEPDDSS